MATGDFVQQLATAGGAAATSVTATLSVASAAGNSIVVFTAQASAASTPVSCTDSKGNTYVLLASQVGRDPNQAIWMASGSVTPLVSGDTITASWSASGAGVSLDALEFVGNFDTSTPVAIGNNSAASSTTFDSGSGTVPAGGQLLLGTVGRPAATAFTPAPSADGTWTAAPIPTNATSFGRAYRPAYQYRSAGGGTLRFTGSVGGTAFASNTLAVAVATLSTAFTGTLARTGVGSLTFSGVASPTGALARTGVGSLTFGGVASPTGALARTGVGSLSLSGQKVVGSTMALSGSGTLVLGGQSTPFGTLARTGVGTLTLAGIRVVTGALILTGQGVLTLTPDYGPIFVFDGLSWVKVIARVRDDQWVFDIVVPLEDVP